MARGNSIPMKTKAAVHYLSGVKRSLQRLDEPGFNHYNLKLKDKQLVRYILARAYIEKRFMPQFVAELLVKGLKTDKTFQEYVDQNLQISIETSTAMKLESRVYCAEKQEREKGHSQITGLNH